MSMLDTILAPDGLRIHCQPIMYVSSTSQRIHGVECLCRGPEGTPFFSPLVLFDYVRRKRAEAIVDRHVVDLSFATCSALSPDLRVSVNVHASSLVRDGQFADHVSRSAAKHRLAASRIVIEIVEHAPALNAAEFLQTLSDLRDRGFRIALDDIGMGHSNYRMMLDAHPDLFKIDSYIVQGASVDPSRRAVLESIAKLAECFGGEVIAEGVERRADLEVLLALGIHLIQGHLFYKAMPAESISSCFTLVPKS